MTDTGKKIATEMTTIGKTTGIEEAKNTQAMTGTGKRIVTPMAKIGQTAGIGVTGMAAAMAAATMRVTGVTMETG